MISLVSGCFLVWEHLGSNQGPPACKAGALNQLSYAPMLFLKSHSTLCLNEDANLHRFLNLATEIEKNNFIDICFLQNLLQVFCK